jgi:hypothetical protein
MGAASNTTEGKETRIKRACGLWFGRVFVGNIGKEAVIGRGALGDFGSLALNEEMMVPYSQS